LCWVITCSNDGAASMSEEAWASCVNDWVKAFLHPNYLKIGGRPVFKVIAPHFLLNRQCSIAASSCSDIIGARDWPTLVLTGGCPKGSATPNSNASVCTRSQRRRLQQYAAVVCGSRASARPGRRRTVSD
jgi:hypothetical protein